MKRLQDKENVIAPDVNNIYGSLKDDTGAHDGTYADTEMMQDSMVFCERMISESGVVPNGLNDNVTNGFQIYEAFRKLTKPYKSYTCLITQSGASAPTVEILGLNEIGSIVWTRTSTGTYRGTLVGEFIDNKTFFVFTPNTTFADIDYALTRISSDYFLLRMFIGGALFDGALTDASLEVRVYD